MNSRVVKTRLPVRVLAAAHSRPFLIGFSSSPSGRAGRPYEKGSHDRQIVAGQFIPAPEQQVTVGPQKADLAPPNPQANTS